MSALTGWWNPRLKKNFQRYSLYVFNLILFLSWETIGNLIIKFPLKSIHTQGKLLGYNGVLWSFYRGQGHLL